MFDTEIKTWCCVVDEEVEDWSTCMCVYDNILKIDVYVPSGPGCDWVYMCFV